MPENLAKNGGLETNLDGWHTRDGGDVIARSAEQIASGAYSLKTTLSAAGFSGPFFDGFIGIEAGRQYTVSFQLYVPTGNPALFLEVYKQGHAALIDGVSIASTHDAWFRTEFTFTTPAGTTGLTVDVRKGAGAETTSFYLDELQLEPGAVASEYIETDGAAGVLLSASSSGAPTIARSVGTVLSVTSLMSASMARAMATAIAATSTAAASVARSVGKVLIGSEAAAAAITRSIAKTVSVPPPWRYLAGGWTTYDAGWATGPVTHSAALTRVTGKAISLPVAATATMTRVHRLVARMLRPAAGIARRDSTPGAGGAGKR
ncbi:MAG: Carbohydrate binding domain [Pseudomonadota bacterium]|jgi:hypothetical protein